MNTVRPHFAQAWRNIRDQDRLRALVDAASDASSLQGWGVIVLQNPPEELTPGTLTTLYRYFGRPSRTSPFPGRVQRWLGAQLAAHDLRPDLELRRPLSAKIDSRRVVLQFLPPQRAHPGAIVVREWEERERLSLEELGAERARGGGCSPGDNRHAECHDRRGVAPVARHGKKTSRQRLQQARRARPWRTDGLRLGYRRALAPVAVTADSLAVITVIVCA
jgi:hypothetical protein